MLIQNCDYQLTCNHLGYRNVLWNQVLYWRKGVAKSMIIVNEPQLKALPQTVPDLQLIFYEIQLHLKTKTESYCTLKVFYLPTPTCPDQASFLLDEEVSILCFSDPGVKLADLKWVWNGQPVKYKTFTAVETIHILYYTFTTDGNGDIEYSSELLTFI